MRIVGHAHEQLGRRQVLKKGNSLFQQPVIDFSLLLGNDTVTSLAQIVALHKGGDALRDENDRNRNRNLQDNVKTLLQINTIDDITHYPRAERRRACDNNHCRNRRRIPANVFFEVFFKKSRQQLLVVWRQKRSDQGNILFSFGYTRRSLSANLPERFSSIEYVLKSQWGRRFASHSLSPKNYRVAPQWLHR
ncbi:hypothetical protein D3C87_1395630 [compost metagenome]